MPSTSPALDLLSISLLAAIRLASEPGCTARQYVPANRDCHRLAHLIHREFTACQWRETMRQSAALAAKAPRGTFVDDFTPNPYMPGFRSR